MKRRKEERVIKFKRVDDHLLFYGLRVINFRPFLLFALSFAAGILCCYLFGFYAFLINLIILPALVGFIFILKKKGRRIAGVFLACTAAACVIFSIGGLALAVRIADFETAGAVSGECYVEGVVKEIAETSDSKVYTLGDLTIVSGETGEIVRTDYRIRIYIYGGGTELTLGARAIFNTEVTTYETWAYGHINTSAILDRVRYFAFAEPDSFLTVGQEAPDVFGLVGEHIREVVFSGMDDSAAALAYAMLTGNAGFMDEDVLQNFRYGGVAHIFAVSGLHIGIVYLLLSVLFKKLRLKLWLRFLLITAGLVFYAGVCSFSPSSVRALIMCVVMMAMKFKGVQYDRLNSVSIAALAVLAINPVYLFSVGFILSVSAAGGIIVLGAHLSRNFARIPHMPRKLAFALGTALSAQICTFPVLIDFFGYISAISFVLNLLFIPVISSVYAVLFVAGVLASVLPFASAALLFIPEYLLRLAVLPIVMADFRFWLICGFSFGGCSLLWYFGIYFLSDKINLRVWVKAIGATLLSGVFVCLMVMRNVSLGMDGYMTVHGYYGSNFVLIHEGGNVVMVCLGVPDSDHIEKIFLKENITEIDALVSLGTASDANMVLPIVLENAQVKKMYVNAELGFVNTFQTVEVQEVSSFFDCGGMDMIFSAEEALYVNFGNADVLFVEDIEEGAEGLPDCDLMITAYGGDFLQNINREEEIYFEKADGKMSVYSLGDLQIGRRDGIISVKEAV